MARRHNSWWKGLLKLLASNLYYAMDGAVIRVVAATDQGLFIANPYFQVSNTQFADLDDKYIQIIPWEQALPVTIDRNWRIATLSWMDGGKRKTWVVDLDNPGIWSFNPANLDRFQKAIQEKGQQQ
ncbi:hypothetical protein RQN30_07020 [Arcanobacterium hippocoleae]